MTLDILILIGLGLITMAGFIRVVADIVEDILAKHEKKTKEIDPTEVGDAD